MQSNRWFQALIILLVIIAAAWLAGQVWSFLIQFSNIFLLFFLSWLLAFVLRPTARWLTRGGMPYTLAVVMVYLALALIFTIGGFLLVPIISTQVSQLISQYPSITSNLNDLATQADATLQSWGLNQVDLQKFYSDLAGQAQAVVLSVLQNTFTLLQSIATLAVQLVLVFLLSFYFMKDGERLSNGILQLLPPRWQDEIRLVALSIEKSFGSFIRGQLVFALVYGVLTAIVMMMPPFQLDYVVIASIVAGLCMIIPLVGNFLAYIPPMLVLLVTPPKVPLWWELLIVLFIMQGLMMNFLGPRIMSSAIGIHPLYVMGAMLLGGQVAGLWGALFGIPVAGAINLIGRPLMRRIRHQMPLYAELGSGSLPTSAFATGPLAASILSSRAASAAHSRAAEAESLRTTTLRDVPEPAAASEAAGPAEVLKELEQDLVIPPQPTLSVRVLRLALFITSRGFSWAWMRLHTPTRKERLQ